ncbi:MAG: transcriptional repressor [Christensenellaceae bacterium]
MQERQTRQKSIIYDALKTLDHPTATEVYGYVHERHPSVSRATVFRVLGGFAQTGRALGCGWREARPHDYLPAATTRPPSRWRLRTC